MAKKLELSAIKINQPNKEGQEIFLTSIKIRYLIDEEYFRVNWWERDKIGLKTQGYQRRPAENRRRKIVKYIENYSNPIFPTSILINSSKPLKFKEERQGFGKLIIGEIVGTYPCWIVDGQTRIEGFKSAVNDSKHDHILEHEMPVTILSNFELYDELEQFFILNSTQKRVPTDLAQRLRMVIARKDPGKYESLGIGGKWELIALQVVDILNRSGETVWQNRIKLPNTLGKTPSSIVSQNSFITSLKPLLINKKGGILENVKPDSIYEILKNYWNAIRRVFPYAFSKPKEYVIQKTPGVFSLHDLANDVLKSLALQKKDYTERNIQEILETVFKDDKYTDDFWRGGKGVKGGAAMAGSMKGFALLAEEFKGNLPNISIKT